MPRSARPATKPPAAFQPGDHVVTPRGLRGEVLRQVRDRFEVRYASNPPGMPSGLDGRAHMSARTVVLRGALLKPAPQ